MKNDLYKLSEDFAGICDLVENEDVDPLSVSDHIDAIDMEFDKKVISLALSIKNIEAPLDAIKAEIERLKRMESSIKSNSSYFKGYILDNMKAINKKKVKGDFVSVTVLEGRESVSIDDIDSISDEYTNVKVEVVPDKKAIKKAIKELEEGVVFPGASLVRGDKTLKIS